jgi:hypothetical protein
MRRPALFSVLTLALALTFGPACTKPPPEGAPVRVAEASATRAAASEPPNGDAAAAVPPVDASAVGPGSSAGPASSASVAAAKDDAPVRVKLVTIGMHVGGGPYDEPTKEPMKRSVEPHFADLARCWKLVAQPKQTDVGVDLVIEANGGRARVSNPRTTATGEGFLPCVVAFFEGVDFLPPKNGKTVVSYSVRFLP